MATIYGIGNKMSSIKKSYMLYVGVYKSLYLRYILYVIVK